jgi:hypothetical protein
VNNTDSLKKLSDEMGHDETGSKEA